MVIHTKFKGVFIDPELFESKVYKHCDTYFIYDAIQIQIQIQRGYERGSLRRTA